MSRFAPFIPIAPGGADQAQAMAQTAMQKATLDAQTKLEQERIKSQEKQAQQALEAQASEHLKYQQFQAEQQMQQQGYQAEQNRLDRESQDSYRNKMIERQDKLLEAHKAAQKAKLEFIAQTMKDKAGMSAARKGEWDKLDAEHRKVKGALGAAELELGQLQAGRGLALKKVKEMGDNLSAGALELRKNSGDLARFGIGQAVLDAKQFPGFWEKARKDVENLTGVSNAGPLAKGVIGGMGAIGRNIADFFGADTDVGRTAYTDLAAFAEASSGELAKKLTSVAKPGASGLKEAINQFILAGADVHSAMSGDAHPDIVKDAQARFDKAVGDLKKVVPDEAIGGIADALGDVESSFNTAKDSTSSLFKSTKEAHKKVINTITGVKGALEYLNHDPNSVNKLRSVDKGLGDALTSWVAARATMSMNKDEFITEMKGHGLDENDVKTLLEGAKELFGERTPERLNTYIRELKGKEEELGKRGMDMQRTEEELGLLDTADTLTKFADPMSGMVD